MRKSTRHPHFLKAKSYKLKARGGFTLVELLVSIAIVVLISTIVLGNYRGFESSLTVQSLAYEVALALRQAQVFSLSVQGFGGNFNVAYGIHFEHSDPTTFFLYVDQNNNATYDPLPGPDVIIETFTLREGSTIVNLCAQKTLLQCNLQALDVVYERPNPDANITSFDGTTRIFGNSSATIHIRSPQGVNKQVRAMLSGQISVVR